MSVQLDFEELAEQAKRLPLADKVRLLEYLAPSIAQDVRKSAKPRRSLRGLWKDIPISDADIDEVRTEMWHGFPRDDI
jgi:hypothetical protein